MGKERGKIIFKAPVILCIDFCDCPQYTNLHLDGDGGVFGVSAIRSSAPNWRERIADYEASGKLHLALVSYERVSSSVLVFRHVILKVPPCEFVWFI